MTRASAPTAAAATEEARVLANGGLWRTWTGIGGWLTGVLVGLSALRDARTGASGSFGGFSYSRIELGLALDIGGAAFVVWGVELRRRARRLRADLRNANGDPDRPSTAVAR